MTFVLVRPFRKQPTPLDSAEWRGRKNRWRCVFAGDLLAAIERSELEQDAAVEVSVVHEHALTPLELAAYLAQSKGVERPVR